MFFLYIYIAKFKGKKGNGHVKLDIQYLGNLYKIST